MQKPTYHRYRNNTEQGEKQFGEYFHTESHATILSKVDVEPICDSDALVPVHVSLNPNLDNLVYN